MKTCDTCKGSGLVGQGPNPHLREGRTETCSACSGTGQVAEVGTDSTNGEVGKDESKGEEGGVDNSEDDPAPKRGILARIFRRNS